MIASSSQSAVDHKMLAHVVDQHIKQATHNRSQSLTASAEAVFTQRQKCRIPLRVKARQRKGGQIEARCFALSKLTGNFAQHRRKLKAVAAQPGDQQRVWPAWQRIDNKVLIDGIVVGTGGAVQAAADASRTLRKNGKDSEPSLATAPNATLSCGVEIGWPPLCLPIFSSLSSAGKP